MQRSWRDCAEDKACTCIPRAVPMSARVRLPLSTGYRQYWKRCYPAFTGSTLTNSTVLSSRAIPPSAKPPSLTVPDTGRAAHRSLRTQRETSHIPDTARQTSPASKRRADGKSGWAHFYIYVNKKSPLQLPPQKCSRC